jgi:hypothetical protein
MTNKGARECMPTSEHRSTPPGGCKPELNIAEKEAESIGILG